MTGRSRSLLSAVLVFAKPPEAGRVKTRLLGTLSPEQAARVHRACLKDTTRHVARVPGCQKWLRVAGPMAQALPLAKSLGLDARWKLSVQRGRDLGARLAEAFEAMFSQGCSKVVAVGSDTPWMGSARISQALDRLEEADVVLGPTADGGYYLVGMRRLIPELFSRIPWSTSQVFRSTLRALEKAPATHRLLPCDFDLDRREDLERAAELLRANPERAPALARLLAEFEPAILNKSSPRR